MVGEIFRTHGANLRKGLIQKLTCAKEYNIAGGGTHAAKSSSWLDSIFGAAARWASALAVRIRSGTRQLRQSGATHSRGPEETRAQFHPDRCEGRHHQSVDLQGKGCSSRFLGDMVRRM